MDIRASIIDNILLELRDIVPMETLNFINDKLTIELQKYEVQERCTDVAVIDNSPITILNRFVATKRIEGIAETTLRRYKDENWKLLSFLGKSLDEITTYDLRYYLSLKRQTNKLSNRTLDGMRRCYSSFFSWITAEGIIDRNPCLALAPIKYRKQVKKAFSQVELERIREACKSKRDLALVDFLYSTGCRVSEVSSLTISDVDFEKQELIVLGKGNKERVVYLTDVAAMRLKEYLDSRTDCSEALFLGKGNRAFQKNGIEAMLKRIGEVAGVENVHPHRFRRTLTTNLLARGMSVQNVAAVLGHSDIKTTMIYCCIDNQNVKTSYAKYAA